MDNNSPNPGPSTSSKKIKKSVKKLGLINIIAPTSETFCEPNDLVTPEFLLSAIENFDDLYSFLIEHH